MIAMMLADLASAMSPALVAAAEDEGGAGWLLLLGPAGGAGSYFLFWRYYRNTDKSHSFERETRIAAQPIVADDAKIDEVKGTKRAQIDGENRTDHRQRVQRLDAP